jgi:uncharacterized membrane protein
MSSKWRRWRIVGLSTLGLLDSLYMLAYHEGWIDSLACPFFGEGCNIVGRSKEARHFGIPNAAVVTGAVLTWEQKSKVRAWCFWCLTSVAINALILSATVAEVVQQRKKAH